MQARQLINAVAIAVVFAAGLVAGIALPQAEARGGTSHPGWECPDANTCFFFNGPKFFVVQRATTGSEWTLEEVRQPRPSAFTKPTSSVPLLETLR